VDWEIARVAGGSGGRESRFERFGDLHDIDIMLPTIDWVGDLRNRKTKRSSSLKSCIGALTLLGLPANPGSV
jgi:hypothetical protein